MVDHLIGDKGIAHWLFVEHFKDYDKWPWARLNKLEYQWAEHKSFVVCEFTFIALVIVSFIHACSASDPEKSRRLKLMWVATFIVGTVNDYTFMLLPVCDNFWQAQATIMLSPRMPLYIPCVYNCFMYWPLVAAARVFHHSNKSRLAEACLCGLLGGLFYAPYDVNGARFLWWTWHDSDPPIGLRWLGVPAGSTAWTLTFNFSLCYLLRVGYDRGWGQLPSLLLACASTPMMILVLNCFNILGMDKFTVPGVRTLLAVIAVYSAVCAYKCAIPGKAVSPLPRSEPKILMLIMVIYFAIHAGIMAVFNPEDQISTGAHQVYGPCEMQDVDMMMMPRNRFVCTDRYNDGWTIEDSTATPSSLDRKFPVNWYFGFDCPRQLHGATGRWAHITPEEARKVDPGNPQGAEVASWYTVCGRKHEEWQVWMAAVGGLCAFGALLFPCVFSVKTSASNKKKTGKHE